MNTSDIYLSHRSSSTNSSNNRCVSHMREFHESSEDIVVSTSSPSVPIPMPTTSSSPSVSNSRCYSYISQTRKFARIHSNEDLENISKDLSYQLGLVMGLAAYNDVLIDLPLPPSIYKILKGTKFNLEDLFEVDSTLAKGLKILLDYDDGSIADVFGTTFTASSNPLLDNCSYTNTINSRNSSPSPALVVSNDRVEPTESIDSMEIDSTEVLDSSNHHHYHHCNVASYDSRTEPPSYIELKPGGNDIYVDKSNRNEFVNLFLQWTLYGSVKSLVDSYLSGIKILFEDPIISLCTHSEIEVLLSGSKDIGDLSYLRLHTKYSGEYHDEHPIIQWFWDILSNMTKYDQRKFLHFVTGSDRVPVGGISKLGLVIQSTGQSPCALPTSHTCFNVLNIPSTYISKEHLKEKISTALKYSEGFGFA